MNSQLRFHLARAVLAATLAPCPAWADKTADTGKSLGDTSQVQVRDGRELRPPRTDAAMERWRDNRFGVFIHWGIFSMPGGVVDGKIVPGAAEWIWTSYANKGRKAEYESLAREFDPVKYDPAAWAKAIKQSGAKYVVFVTKHHDGFCLFDSKLTDYDSAGSKYGKDILKPFVEAVAAEGIDIGLYYSIIDWHHPNYTAKELKTGTDHESYRKYLDYMKGQLKELLTAYGDVKILWFDGRWDASYKNNPQYGKEVEDFCRSVKPGIIINDRVRAYDSFADYDASYERRLPEPAKVLNLDWECCMTMPERTWGYHTAPDGAGWKTPRKIIGQLAECASRGGNFLLNLGPKPDGSIRDEELARLREVGRWMAAHGGAIYGTRPAGLDLTEKNHEPGNGVFATRKGDTLHLILTRWPDTDRIFLPKLAEKILSAELVGNGGGTVLSASTENRKEGDVPFISGLPLHPPAGEAAWEIRVKLGGD